VDTDDIKGTIDWIVEHQYDDGMFQEPGRVIHTDMQVSPPVT
jgi:CD109 antigen